MHYPTSILPRRCRLEPDEPITDCVLLLMADGYYQVPPWAHTYDYVVHRIRSNEWIESRLPVDEQVPASEVALFRGTLERREVRLTYRRMCKVMDGAECTDGARVASAVLEWQAAACLRFNKDFREQCFLFAVWFVAFARQCGNLYLEKSLDAFETYAKFWLTAETCSLSVTAMASSAMRWRRDGYRMILWSKVLEAVDFARHSYLGFLGSESETRCALHRTDCPVWAFYTASVD